MTVVNPQELQEENARLNKQVQTLKKRHYDLAERENKERWYRTLTNIIDGKRTKRLTPGHKLVLRRAFHRIMFGPGEIREKYKRVLSAEIKRDDGELVRTETIIKELIQLKLLEQAPEIEFLPDEYWLAIPPDVEYNLDHIDKDRHYGFAWCEECRDWERRPKTIGKGVKVTICSKGHVLKGPSAYKFTASMEGFVNQDLPLDGALETLSQELTEEISKEYGGKRYHDSVA